MKSFIFLLVLVVVAVEAAEKCDKSNECKEDECCLRDLVVFSGGHCKPRRTEGQKCMPSKSAEESDMHYVFCPCGPGLNCEATKIIKMGDHVIKYGYECVVPGEKSTEVEILPTTSYPDWLDKV